MHRALFLSAACLIVLAGPALATPDPAQCARIADVDVPDAVQVMDTHLVFNRGKATVIVGPHAVSAAGTTTPHAVDRYYPDLQAFLQQAARMRHSRPLTALFSGKAAEFAESAARMCDAVLALASSTAQVEAAVPGFRSPVRIRLK